MNNNVMIGAVKSSKKVKPPKYTYGDKLYTYQDPNKPGVVFRIYPSDDPRYAHKYKLTLKGKDGYTYSSNFINETSLFKTKKGLENYLNNLSKK
jgi:hypothetical protein